MLFDHLGLREDQINMIVRPDCADLPYFLRAYFAFKMGLPYGYSKCSRGGGHAPKCVAWLSIQHAETAAAAPSNQAADTTATASANQAPEPPKRLGLAQSFGRYLPILADAVHSGSARTALDDNNTDYYPVPLTRETLRPGVVYADPYGHVLMLVRRLPQTEAAAGVFFAVDGQPDGTVARKRFWRGNFLFAQDPKLGGPGFKRFRPIVQAKSGALRRLTNDEIAKDPQYGDFSLEQAQLSVEDFYDRMDDVMSPAPLDPLRAMKEAITSLEEQVKARVTSVENGRKYQNSGRPDVEMPAGPTDLRDHRRVGGFRHAVARPSAVDRDRRGAHLPRSRRPAAGTLRHAGRQERRRRQGRARARAGGGASGAQVFLPAQRRLVVDLVAPGRGRPLARPRNGLQPQRLRRAALGRAGQERRGVDLQAARLVDAARQDDRLPRLVPRPAPPGAARLAVRTSCREDDRRLKRSRRQARTLTLFAAP